VLICHSLNQQLELISSLITYHEGLTLRSTHDLLGRWEVAPVPEILCARAHVSANMPHLGDVAICAGMITNPGEIV
jgi:hypothetical protein